MFRPEHRYLFNREEITIGAKDFQAISVTLVQSIHPITEDLFFNFHKTLKRSFNSEKLLSDYPSLTATCFFYWCCLCRFR